LSYWGVAQAVEEAVAVQVLPSFLAVGKASTLSVFFPLSLDLGNQLKLLVEKLEL
jgi:hypothetical protein